MNNPFDDRIKQSLEGFEMPYDATAWAQLEKQLPAGGGATGGRSAWKSAATVAAVVATVATVWYLTRPTENNLADVPTVEETISQEEAATTEEQHSPETVETVTPTDGKAQAATQPEARPESVRTDRSADRKESVNAETTAAPAAKEKPSDAAPSSANKENGPEKIDSKVETPIEERALAVSFVPSSLKTCVGEDVSFISSASEARTAMNWDFGDGTMSDEANPVHSYVLPGNYTVSLSATNGKKEAEHTVTVTVNPTPMPVFSGSRKLEGYEAIPLYRFSTATQPSETAVWSFSDGTKIVGNVAEHLFREEGKQTARLTVTNAFGCSSTMDETYEMKEFTLIAPGNFTPNGDGLNETFIPAALAEMGVAFEMTIQNPRTGEVVYRTENATEPWNGKMSNLGNNAENGVYIWTVVLKENILKNKTFNGRITLQR